MNDLIRRLLWPLLLSVAIHAVLFVPFTLRAGSAINATVDVRLPRIEVTPDGLLKNTLNKTSRPGGYSPPMNAAKQDAAIAAAQQRLSAHVFYPPRAVEQGWEGEVQVLLRLDGTGNILDARVVGSSGRELLDQAALAAIRAATPFPGSTNELILPVRFRLSE